MMSVLDRLRLQYLPQLEFCCCGCSLRAGSLVIGWTVLVAHALLTSILANVAVQVLAGTHIPPVLDDGSPVISDLELFGTIVMSLACLITAFVLIVGVHKSQPKYFVPFMLLLSITAIFELIVFGLGFAFVLFDIVSGVPPRLNFSEKIFSFFDGFLNIYFVLVIHSYYNILRQSSSYLRENV
nr:PREDICTED: uncharacterized protein LOC109032750 [Bemisia tabaci]